MSINKTLKAYRGEVFGYGFEYEMPAGAWTVTAKIKKVSDGSLVQTLSAAIVAPVPPALESLITIRATDEQTMSWPIETLKFDLRFEDSGGDVFYIPAAEDGPVYVKVLDAVTYG